MIGLYVAPTLLWSVLAGALFTVRLFVNGMHDSPRMNPSESPLEWGHEDAPRWVLPLAPTAIQFLLAIPASVAVLSGPQVRPR